MIHVIASIQIKKEEFTAFLSIFKANIPHVLKEKGCIEYELTIDYPTDLPPQEKNPHGVTVIEKWLDFEALQAHLTAPHMLNYKDQVADIVEAVSLKILKQA